jgi:hypothetical protein
VLETLANQNSNSNRREFIGHMTRSAAELYLARTLLLSTATGSALALGGCDVWSAIVSWEPTAKAALNGIITILGANGFPISQAAAAIVQTIEAALDQLIADVQAYKAVTPPPVGALQKIETAFSIITANFQTFLADIQVPDSPLLETIVAIVRVILSTIAGFENKTGAGVVSSAMRIGGARGNARVITITPKLRTPGGFKRDYNSQLAAGATAGVKCPPEVYLKLTFAQRMHFPGA